MATWHIGGQRVSVTRMAVRMFTSREDYRGQDPQTESKTKHDKPTSGSYTSREDYRGQKAGGDSKTKEKPMTLAHRLRKASGKKMGKKRRKRMEDKPPTKLGKRSRKRGKSKKMREPPPDAMGD